MSAVSSEIPSAMRKSPQRADNSRNIERNAALRHALMREQHRDKIIALADEVADLPGPTSELVAERLEAQHVRLSVDDVDSVLDSARREFRQQYLSLRNWVEGGLRESAGIPRQNREERLEAA